MIDRRSLLAADTSPRPVWVLRLAMAINRFALPTAGALILLAAGGALARLGG